MKEPRCRPRSGSTMPVRGMCSLGPKETAQPDRVFAAGDATALLRCPRHVLTEVFIFVSVEKPLPSTTAAGNHVPLCSTSHFVLPWFSFILRRRTFLLSPTCLSLLPQPVPPLLSLSLAVHPCHLPRLRAPPSVTVSRSCDRFRDCS